MNRPIRTLTESQLEAHRAWHEAGGSDDTEGRVNLHQVQLIRTRLNALHLERICFDDVVLDTVQFVSAFLQGARFTHSSLTNVAFRVAKLHHAEFDHCTLNGALFGFSQGGGGMFREVTAPVSECERTRWPEARFEACDLRSGNFKLSQLNNAVFTRCNLAKSNFSKATLDGVHFIECTLTDVRWPDGAPSWTRSDEA